MEQVEQALRILVGCTVEVDQADQNALALRILGEAVFEDSLALEGVTLCEIEVGEVGEDVTFLIETNFSATVVVLDGVLTVACESGNQCGVVAVGGVDHADQSVLGAVNCILEDTCCILVVTNEVVAECLIEHALVDVAHLLGEVFGLSALDVQFVSLQVSVFSLYEQIALECRLGHDIELERAIGAVVEHLVVIVVSDVLCAIANFVGGLENLLFLDEQLDLRTRRVQQDVADRLVVCAKICVTKLNPGSRLEVLLGIACLNECLVEELLCLGGGLRFNRTGERYGEEKRQCKNCLFHNRDIGCY